MICALVGSPLTSENDRKKVVSGMSNLSTEFLDSIQRNRATAFEGLLKKASKDSRYGDQAKAGLASFSEGDGGKLVGELSLAEASSAVLSMEGDIEEGKELFVRQSCGACHSILPDEPQKGPYLGTVGNLFNREQLITHVIDPGAEVAQGFQTYNFQLKDGNFASGFVTARDENIIEVRNVAGISQTIPANEVTKEDVLEISMMPPGLVNTLTIRQFASLIDYLQSLH